MKEKLKATSEQNGYFKINFTIHEDRHRTTFHYYQYTGHDIFQALHR